jgi:predicted ATPase/DNA-binding SARP family transcriptional activator
MAERMRISLTGHLVVEVGAAAADGAALGPLGALALAYLVSERHRPVARDELAEVLWGDDLPSTWEPSLRSIVSRVRRRLEAAGVAGQAIVGGGGCYELQLPAEAVIDVEEAGANVGEASEALARGDWERALDLAAAAADVAGRRFLPGLSGLWVERRQAELDELGTRALEVLSDAASAGGHHRSAVSAAEAAIAAQPLRESAYVRLMAVHVGAGDRGEALRAYERCRIVLAEELGASPSERMQAAYLALLSDERPGPTGPSTTNLRPELSSFVGRAEQVRQVTKLLGHNRLVTLVGPGGVGKTRLAGRVGAELVDHYRDGVWLVELAALADASLVAHHVISALGLAEETASTPVESIRGHLADRALLLIVDNCEHLSAACATLVMDLLSTCPGLVVLATSRERLGVRGETLWPVPPLSVPHATDAAPDRIWESDSVRLFVERASAMDPEFRLSAETAPALADICRRLDGLPLAIELAAARVRSLSVAEISARLRDRFHLLVGRDPTVSHRHHTLRAAVDWSHEALSDAQQRLFRRVAVFAGGFNMDAAERVCVPSSDNLDVLEGLAALVDKSLVVADRTEPTTRYRLLETLRQYGAARLSAAGEESEIHARHLAWVRTLAEAAQRELEGAEQPVWLQRLDAEEDNVRAALDWAVAHPTGDDGLRVAGALWRYWQVRSRFDEGSRWLRSLLEVTTDAPAGVRADALASTAVLLLARSEAPLSLDEADAVRSLFEECVTIRRALGDRLGVASALHGLGGVYYRQWDADKARPCFEDTLAIGRELDEKRLVAASLTNLANLAMRHGNAENTATEGLEARALYEESLALWRNLGDLFATARALGDLAGIAYRERRFTAARALLGESIVIHRRLDNRRGVAACTTQLADIAERDGDWAAAQSLLEEALAIGRELRDPFMEAERLIELAEVWWMQDELAEAERLYEEAEAIARTLVLGLPLCNALSGQGTLALVRDQVAEARRLFEEAAAVARRAHDLEGDNPWSPANLANVALAEGKRLEALEQCRTVLTFCLRPDRLPTWALATVLDVLAVLASVEGRPEPAVMLIGAADGMRDGDPFVPFRTRGDFQRAMAAARDGLGHVGYDSALARGRALPFADVVALAKTMLG